MLDPLALDEQFNKILDNMPASIPDGIVEIDKHIMDSFGIELQADKIDFTQDAKANNYFYVLEAFDKITLVNDHFVVWLLPIVSSPDESQTLAFLARKLQKNVQLEMVYSTRGRFNQPAIVLRLLECFLEEIQENDLVMKNII